MDQVSLWRSRVCPSSLSVGPLALGVVSWFGDHFHSSSRLGFYKPLATTLPVFGIKDNLNFIWVQPMGLRKT